MILWIIYYDLQSINHKHKLKNLKYFMNHRNLVMDHIL
jgi:hypothetical protein